MRTKPTTAAEAMIRYKMRVAAARAKFDETIGRILEKARREKIARLKKRISS